MTKQCGLQKGGMSAVQNVLGGRRREATGVLTRKGISSLPWISNSKQGVKRHRHVNKLKTDTMRPQFLGLDWDCHLQYPWNAMGMTAEMEGGRNASDRLDRKEMPQNSLREHEQQKLKRTHLCWCHWRSKLTLHDDFPQQLFSCQQPI